MNVYEIKEYLFENKEYLKILLEDLGFYNIRFKSNEVRCGLDHDSNPTSVRIKLNEKLYIKIFSRNFEGDILNLVTLIKKLEYPDNINYICNLLGLENNEIEYKKPYKIFEGFFEKIKKNDITNIELPRYDENILKQFDDTSNLRFLRDGISLKAQKFFNVGFDIESQRITVPWREAKQFGEIIGVMGRYNGDDFEEKNISKWFPIISFPKQLSLFGYSQNFNYLKNKYIFVFESEKSVMQCFSFSKTVRNCVAVGCHDIGSYQLKLLQMLEPKGIILAFDEGLGENEIPLRTYEDVVLPICEAIKPKGILKYKVGYIYDRNNKYMKKGSKVSPSDLGEETFKKICNECIKWVY